MLYPELPWVGMWLTGVLQFYQQLGYTVPDIDSPTDYGFPVARDIHDLEEFYRAILSGTVVHPKTGEMLGITPDMWSTMPNPRPTPTPDIPVAPNQPDDPTPTLDQPNTLTPDFPNNPTPDSPDAPSPNPPTDKNDGSSGGGCDTGLSTLALLTLVTLLRKQS